MNSKGEIVDEVLDENIVAKPKVSVEVSSKNDIKFNIVNLMDTREFKGSVIKGERSFWYTGYGAWTDGKKFSIAVFTDSNGELVFMTFKQLKDVSRVSKLYKNLLTAWKL